MLGIQRIESLAIPYAHGKPALQAAVTLKSGRRDRAPLPSGTSAGTREAQG
ncbi:MAG TPA: hypothetical protein VFZ07_06820 [Dongiaceae bacterium]